MYKTDYEERLTALEKQLQQERDATRQNNIELWSELDILIRRQNICRAIALVALILSLIAIFG